MLSSTKKKISDSLKEFYRSHPLATSGAGAVAGAKTLIKQYSSGNLTGRQTLYHGTSNKRAASILKNGFDGTKTGISNAVNPALHTANKGLVFSAKTKSMAKIYARQQAALDTGVKDLFEARRILRSKAVKAASDKGIVKLNIPTWKDGLGSAVNPEVAMQKAKIAASGAGKVSRKLQNFVVDELLGPKAVHVARGVSKTHIKGNAAYKSNSVAEIVEYATKNKVRIAGGAGKAALGAAIVGASGVALAKESKRQNTLVGRVQKTLRKSIKARKSRSDNAE